MRVLVVSTYPPMNCGIGAYAAQQVESMRRQGHVVDALTPPEGDGDFQDELTGGFRIARLLKRALAYDEVYLHFAPQLYYDARPEKRLGRLATSLGFLLIMLCMGRRVRFIIHETGFRLGESHSRGLLRHWIDRIYWRLAGRVIFHSTREREEFSRFYRLAADRPQFEIWEHHRHMIPRFAGDRRMARERLGYPQDVRLFLCIGFIQMHKGFERPLRAMRQVASPRARLAVVGSVRWAWIKVHEYARELHELADADPRCGVYETFLTDELFDLWLVASDAVILPYKEIWTSGVAARARLLGRPILATDTGGLAEQMGEGSALFHTDEDLAALIDQICQPPAGMHDPAQLLA